MTGLQSIVVVTLVLVRLLSGKLRFPDTAPRSRWLSFVGGISVAYVFVHVFPELQEAQLEFARHVGASWLDHHVYVVALIGLRPSVRGRQRPDLPA